MVPGLPVVKREIYKTFFSPLCRDPLLAPRLNFLLQILSRKGWEVRGEGKLPFTSLFSPYRLVLKELCACREPFSPYSEPHSLGLG